MSDFKLTNIKEMVGGTKAGKWHSLYVIVNKMQVGEINTFEFSNKADKNSAQACLNGGMNTNASRLIAGMRFQTSSAPVNGNKEGAYYLSVKRLA